ncbi:AlbA family DNA-binding domain-containing protein [Dyadobacter sandarakinus]|uniref:ATP-binding protein n=1 Tax=Dyadobacter sandarakinus TaxID=2747268 RepID=A0ABX7I0P2_9BACT|nr:ATP-binding protein [Dyadobacter sandarakinus]QRQ99605.1 ATP-binding protein [Dyadobacter sandarakinus]
MDKSIIQLIQQGEGLTVEFKRTIDSSFKIAKTIVSFANTAGGNLLIGVGDNRALLGVQSELRELQKLEKATMELIEPAITIGIRSEMLDGKRIMLISVEESADKPHYAINEQRKSLIYVRVKDKSMPIPRLLLQGEASENVARLLETKPVKRLVTYLRENDAVNAKVFSRMINISEKRAERLLQELAEEQVLLKITRNKPELYSLKWAK